MFYEFPFPFPFSLFFSFSFFLPPFSLLSLFFPFSLLLRASERILQMHRLSPLNIFPLNRMYIQVNILQIHHLLLLHPLLLLIKMGAPCLPRPHKNKKIDKNPNNHHHVHHRQPHPHNPRILRDEEHAQPKHRSDRGSVIDRH
jgi:hypothetical protein